MALFGAWPGEAALEADEVLPQAASEARAINLGEQLRCPACSFQSINDSDADVARDLRKLVRDHIQTGKSDAEIITFLKSRYGSAVAMAPPTTGPAAMLWVVPGLCMLALVLGLVWRLRRRRTL
jgi:cytochrome c-type biogenesis protein CcmH